jgi:hypothetical protein
MSNEMTHRRQIIHPIAWAWAAGWVLVSTGMVISDVYSSPNRGWTAAYVLGFAGWTIGAAVTIAYVRRQFGANGYLTALSIAGWAIGAFTALVLGFSWMFMWNGGFWGPIVAAALGGAIGGGFTLPLRSPSSLLSLVSASLLGAFSWGVMFLIFQTLAFYAGYLLSALMVYRLGPITGYVWWVELPGWVVPAGICGLLAAQFASMSLRITSRVPGLFQLD